MKRWSSLWVVGLGTLGGLGIGTRTIGVCVPTLLSPPAGAVLDNGCTAGGKPKVWSFDWSDCAGASAYHLRVHRSGETMALVNRTNLHTSACTYSNDLPVADDALTGWTWKVRATTNGVWGPWSADRPFSVEPVNSDCPTDFRVTSLSMTPTNPTAGGAFTAYVTVKNAGSAGGSVGFVDVWSDKSAPAACGTHGDRSLKIGYLAAGAVTNLTFAGVPVRSGGPRTLRAFVDSACATAELREDNNQSIKTYSTRHGVPSDVALIPAGSFQMGNCMNPGEGGTNELPVHSVYVSAFRMDKFEVGKTKWDEVFEWAVSRPAALRYDFSAGGSGKAANHPVNMLNWYDMVKWCNARSEKEGRIPAYYTSAGMTGVYRTGAVDVANAWLRWDAGYRLPTEAEWEKAARGGAAGHRFPWSDVDTVSHNRANYYAGCCYYDLSPLGYQPSYTNGAKPYTSPVGSFPPNGYGLYDMTGNVWEWCWDRHDPGYYASHPTNAWPADPRGPPSGTERVERGDSWENFVSFGRVAYRGSKTPDTFDTTLGFRAVLPGGP